MKPQQKFSVSMCVYGGDDPIWFRNAVESLLSQTCLPDQIVLVVDGPVPEALEAEIGEYEPHPLFKVLRLPENRGHGYARRLGLNSCDHELIAIMDADDLCSPDRFEKQLAAFAADPELSVVGSRMSEFRGTPENIIGYRQVYLTNHEIRQDLKKRCPLNQVTVMLKKSDIQQVGGYMDWYCNEDYYLWVRLYLAGKRFANVPEVLVNVRVGEDMYQRRGGWKYFASERKIQKLMRKEKIIGPVSYLINVSKRFVVQVLMPNSLRSWVFKTFARKQETLEG